MLVGWAELFLLLCPSQAPFPSVLPLELVPIEQEKYDERAGAVASRSVEESVS